MNMWYALLGFGSFALAITVTCLIGMAYADPLERWVRRRLRRRGRDRN